MSLVPKKSTPNFRNLQASFEQPAQDPGQRNLQAIYPPHRSRAGDLAPTNASSSTARIASLTKSIDSVLDTPAAPSRPASPPNRPLAKFRPSWIGPQPSKHTKADIAGHLEPVMKQRVSIDFASPGLQPPVYIFTSLSQPQWEGVEMFPVKQMDGEFTFVRNFDVDEGEYQYKFRLGPGDWWVCDEKREVVDDGAGNRNNRVVVKSHASQAVDSGRPTPERQSSAPKSSSGMMPKPAKQAEPVVIPSDQEARASEMTKAQEIFSSSDKGSSGQQTPEHERADPISNVSDSKAENLHPRQKEITEDEAEPYAMPLLRHESVSPTSHEQDHSPLFRHESIGLGYNHHEDAAPHPIADGSPARPVFRTAMAARLAPQEADPNDPSLHHFPTDHDGIADHIQRTHIRLPEDQTGEDVIISSPASSAAVSDSSSVSAVPALPSVNEEDEQLEKIREAGEQGIEAEQESGEELDPKTEGEAAEAEDADFEPKIPELKVLLVPQVEKTTEEIVVIDRRPSLAEKVGTRNLM